MDDPQTLSFVGAGSLGQAFAGLMALAGQPVTLVGTPSSVERLLRGGHIQLIGVVDQAAPVAPAPAPAGVVGVTADARQLPIRCGLVFTTKGHQLAEAIATVKVGWPGAAEPGSWVAGVQNGIVKDDLLAEAFGAERVVGAVTILGAQREASGEVAVTSLGATYLGELGGGISPRVEAAARALNGAGIPTTATTDIQSVLWTKACNAVGVFAVCVLTRSSSPGLMRNPDLLRAYLSLIRETAAVAKAYGVAIGDYVGFPIRSYLEKSEAEMLALAEARAAAYVKGAGGTESLPSMVQDLLAGRPMEADQIFGDVVRRAEKVGVAVPRIALVRDLVVGLDRATSRGGV